MTGRAKHHTARSRLLLIASIAVAASRVAQPAAASPAPALTAPPADSPRRADVLSDVMRSLAAHPHRRARFTQTEDLAVLDRPIESAGVLIYDAPDRLEERLRSPRPETLTVLADRVTLVRGHERRTFALSRSADLAALIDGLRATLAGNDAALRRTFVVALRGNASRWTLRLAPRPGTLAGRIASIRIDGADGLLRRIAIRATNGDRSVMRLEDSVR